MLADLDALDKVRPQLSRQTVSRTIANRSVTHNAVSVFCKAHCRETGWVSLGKIAAAFSLMGQFGVAIVVEQTLWGWPGSLLSVLPILHRWKKPRSC